MKMKVAMFAALALALTLSFARMASAQDSGNGAAQPPQGQIPQPQSGGVDWKGVGVGAGTLGANVLYIPAKLVYGILGGIGGGAGYLLTGGNTQVSDTIWRSSLGGDYVVTPDMIRGDQPVHFSGPTETAPSALPPVSSGSPDNGGSGMNGTNNSLNPVQSTNSASNSLAPVQPMTSSSIPPSGGTPGNAIHPMDNGTGPVGGGSSHGGSSHHPVAPLPDTSIE
jgi:hypothetical protein